MASGKEERAKTDLFRREVTDSDPNEFERNGGRGGITICLIVPWIGVTAPWRVADVCGALIESVRRRERGKGRKSAQVSCVESDEMLKLFVPAMEADEEATAAVEATAVALPL
jgi:hypothetical protein